MLWYTKKSKLTLDLKFVFSSVYKGWSRTSYLVMGRYEW